MTLQVGQKAPEFTLPNQDHKDISLSSLRGKWVLIYFYPKDNTPGCTREACSLQDNMVHIQSKNLVVIGISKDSVASHKKFAEKYNLEFDLLADTDTKIIQAYGVWQKKKMAGREYMGIVRSSFLINPEGTIAKIYEKVKPDTHAEEVLRDLEKLNK